jgi:hypothetical protein
MPTPSLRAMKSSAPREKIILLSKKTHKRKEQARQLQTQQEAA